MIIKFNITNYKQIIMENTTQGRVLKTNTQRIFVVANDNNTVTLMQGRQDMPNAGLFIISIGGLDALLRRIENEPIITYSEYLADGERLRIAAKESQKLQAERLAAKSKERDIRYIAEYNKLLSCYNTGIIPATLENISIVARYIKASHPSELPHLSINYSSNMYDCDGKLTVGIILDQPIDARPIDEIQEDPENPCMCSKFSFGAPRGHLTHYIKL